MQSIEAYEKSERERELLRFLVAGVREIASGDGHTLESVMKEADESSGTA